MVVVLGAYVLTLGLRDPARVGATDLENLVFDQYKRWVPETTNQFISLVDGHGRADSRATCPGGAPIDRSDRSADHPRLADTRSGQSPSTSQIILKIADDPVNHSFLNGLLRQALSPR